MKRSYRQGFNKHTGDIVVVCSPEDVQSALQSNGKTVTRQRAIELMQENEKQLTCAYHHGWNGEWEESIRLVLEDRVDGLDLTEFISNDNDAEIGD